MEQALFEPDQDVFVPTELTRGPWSPLAQHGGPPVWDERGPIGRSLQSLLVERG
jgi:hypothetical protein